MNENMNQYLAQAITDDLQRRANGPDRLMAHELRTSRRAARRRRRSRR